MKKIKAAIIGQGRSGRNIHGKYLKTDERYIIAAVVDEIKERRERAKEEYGCDIYADYKELFDRKDIDIIINASYSYQHVPITKEFLEKGFNVLSEKPAARHAEDIDMLIKTAEETNSIYAIFQNGRYEGSFMKAKEIIDSGVLGRIMQINITANSFSRRWDWQTLQANDGGNLLNTGPHPMDQAVMLFGEGMPDVKCIMGNANSFGDAEDYVKILLTGKNNPVVDIEVSSCCAYEKPFIDVMGTRGGLTATYEIVKWKYFKEEEAPKQELIKTPLEKDGIPAYCKEEIKWHEFTFEITKEVFGEFKGLSGMFYNMLYNTLVNGEPLEVKPQQVRRQIAVIEECHRQNSFSRP